MTKDELIEKHRYWNVEHIDWWDSTYDYLTSDEAVWESLEANEMTAELEETCE